MPGKILIVDDDPTIIRLLQVNLEMEDYEVATAGDGAQAVIKASNSRPDLIIMDIMMPNMDGWTARSELSKMPDTADIPVIFLSARARQEDFAKGYEAGAAEYITKPFDPMELIQIVQQVLAGTYQRKEQIAGQ